MTDLEKMTRKFNKMKQSRDKYRTENEELKKKLRMSISKDEYYTNTKSMEVGFEIIRQEFKKQVKKAKEEIEKLKDKIGDLDWSLLDAITQKDIAIEERNNGYTHHYSENEKLKEEIEELKGELTGCRLKAINTLSGIKKENLELKEGLIEEHARAERCKDKVLDLADISKGLQKDVKKLKTENQELFEELEYMKKEQKNFNGYMMDD